VGGGGGSVPGRSKRLLEGLGAEEVAEGERDGHRIERVAVNVQARLLIADFFGRVREHDLALAAMEGVLRQEPAYADAHWHVAGVLADLGRDRESRHHLETFLELAPDSPWADVARARLAAGPAMP
jgi:regulator of sirC expression with transglutaminase-like and TPR domain